jgi:charged multivesicular body protein 4
MNSVNEQRDIANEISEAISNTANLGIDIDEVRKIGELVCLATVLMVAL